jgi:hypothetical protein
MPLLSTPPTTGAQPPRTRKPRADKKRTRVVHRHGNRWDFLKLSRIYREQRGLKRNYHYLTDDEAGRAFLTAFLHCGLSVEDAQERARWLDATEMKARQREARRLAFDEIGTLIKLTFEDWLRFEAWKFWPCDVSREGVLAYKRERKREKRRNKRMERRDRLARRTKGCRREDFIMKMLREGPSTQPRLYKRALHSRAFGPVHLFRGCPDLSQKRRRVVRELVRQTIKRLVGRGVVETGPGKTVRLVDFNEETRPAKSTENIAFQSQHLRVDSAIGRNHRRHNGLTPISRNDDGGPLQGQERTLSTHSVEAVGNIRKGQGQTTNGAPTKRHHEVAVRGRSTSQDLPKHNRSMLCAERNVALEESKAAEGRRALTHSRRAVVHHLRAIDLVIGQPCVGGWLTNGPVSKELETTPRRQCQ